MTQPDDANDRHFSDCECEQCNAHGAPDDDAKQTPATPERYRPHTIEELREAARKAGQTLQRRLGRPVITVEMAAHLRCPFPPEDDLCGDAAPATPATDPSERAWNKPVNGELIPCSLTEFLQWCDECRRRHFNQSDGKSFVIVLIAQAIKRLAARRAAPATPADEQGPGERAKAIETLIAYAQDRWGHLHDGLCPSGRNHDTLDPECEVCRAIAALSASPRPAAAGAEEGRNA